MTKTLKLKGLHISGTWVDLMSTEVTDANDMTDEQICKETVDGMTEKGFDTMVFWGDFGAIKFRPKQFDVFTAEIVNT